MKIFKSMGLFHILGDNFIIEMRESGEFESLGMMVYGGIRWINEIVPRLNDDSGEDVLGITQSMQMEDEGKNITFHEIREMVREMGDRCVNVF